MFAALTKEFDEKSLLIRAMLTRQKQLQEDLVTLRVTEDARAKQLETKLTKVEQQQQTKVAALTRRLAEVEFSVHCLSND